MLTSAKRLEKARIRARDGTIGQLHDIYVEDDQWIVRYFVVETGSWLNHRKVLLSPVALQVSFETTEDLVFDLTKGQIENSPPSETARPVSRQHESQLYQYYGWSPYWTGYAPMGIGPMAPAIAVGALLEAAPGSTQKGKADSLVSEAKGDPHLRSVRNVRGYHLEGIDGEIGHVEDFVIDSNHWDICYLIADTKNWWPGKRVLIPVQLFQKISWAEHKLTVALTRDTIKGGPEFDPSVSLAPDYERRLSAYYDVPPRE